MMHRTCPLAYFNVLALRTIILVSIYNHLLMIWIPDLPAAIQLIIRTLRLCHRQVERQMLQVIMSVCQQ